MDIFQQYSCRLCGCKEYIQRQGCARDNVNLKPLECVKCGLVQLSSIDHIESGFYENGHMHDSQPVSIDVELTQSHADTLRRIEQFGDFITDKNLIDIGCGAGSFLISAKSSAREVAGVEPEERYQKHLVDQKIKVFDTIDSIPISQLYDVATLFHVLEHIKDPISFLSSVSALLKRNKNNLEKICIIEVPHANDALLTLYKSEKFSRFTYWSCHLYLFTESTLQICAERAGLKVIKMFQYQRYNLANHLYWLSNGLPGGHNVYRNIMTPELEDAYAVSLGNQKMCDTIIGIFSV